MDELGAVVLAYGRSDRHAALIDDLRRAGVSDEHLIVVHNPDRPQDAWRPTCPEQATLIALPRNLGYAAAMNRGIDAFIERGLQAVLLLTHDARVEPTTLTTLLEAANRAPSYGVLGLAVQGAGGASTSYGSYLRADGIVEHVSERPHGDHVAESMFVDGSALLVRLEACGPSPLPERYFMYFEESELCSAVRKAGWNVGTALDAKARSTSGIRYRRGAFQYLYVRNGLDWIWRNCGRRAGIRYVLYEAWRAVRDVPKPGGQRFGDADLRRAGYLELLARALGLRDFILGRWGPPPDVLLVRSDVRYV
ncbi:MAG TPA: glycosyltransferase family 2 protein [Solirubrobacteraceae bacterium]